MTQKASSNPRLKYPCPYCGANKGFPCKDSSGFDTYSLHKDRPMEPGLKRKPPSTKRKEPKTRVLFTSETTYE